MSAELLFITGMVSWGFFIGIAALIMNEKENGKERDKAEDEWDLFTTAYVMFRQEHDHEIKLAMMADKAADALEHFIEEE